MGMGLITKKQLVFKKCTQYAHTLLFNCMKVCVTNLSRFICARNCSEYLCTTYRPSSVQSSGLSRMTRTNRRRRGGEWRGEDPAAGDDGTDDDCFTPPSDDARNSRPNFFNLLPCVSWCRSNDRVLRRNSKQPAATSSGSMLYTKKYSTAENKLSSSQILARLCTHGQLHYTVWCIFLFLLKPEATVIQSHQHYWALREKFTTRRYVVFFSRTTSIIVVFIHRKQGNMLTL